LNVRGAGNGVSAFGETPSSVTACIFEESEEKEKKKEREALRMEKREHGFCLQDKRKVC
jgi:hypothetical protein